MVVAVEPGDLKRHSLCVAARLLVKIRSNVEVDDHSGIVLHYDIERIQIIVHQPQEVQVRDCL